MLLKEKRNIVKATNTISSKKFGVRINAKLINILSGMYSDQIKAIVRELSTNAADSHVSNGNPNEPFEVTLPSSLDPNFSIRDFGVGLSPEQVETVFTEYGASDKEDSNDFTGCLGLGSKTPFVYYTRTATIESWWNGTHYIYNAYMGEDGIPEMTLLSQKDSSESTGVKITIPVDRYDFTNFRDRAESVYAYFKVQPIFLGTIQPTIPKVEYVLTGENKDWAIRKHNYGSVTRCNAIMGNICYPISFSDSNLDYKYSNILNYANIDIFFDIGDLDISPDRESLSYDARTKNNIILKLKDISKNIIKLIEQTIDSSKTLWEARLNFSAIYNSIPSDILTGVDYRDFKFNGKQLFDSHIMSVNIPSKFLIHQYSKGYKNRVNKSDSHSIIPNKDLTLFECDLNTGSHSRICENINNGNYKKIIVFNFKDGNGNIDSVLRQELIDLLGISDSDLNKTSILPKVNSNSTPRTKRGNSTSVMEFVGNEIYKTKCWNNSQLDLNSKDGYYVEVNSFDVVFNSNEFHPSILEEISTILINQNLWTKETIIGIKTATLPKLNKSTKKWINFCQFALDSLNKELLKYDIQKINLANQELELIGKSNYRYYSSNKNLYYRFSTCDILSIGKYCKNKQSMFFKFCQDIEESEKNAKDFDVVNLLQNAVSKLANQPASSYNIVAPSKSLLNLESAVYKKYPLLELGAKNNSLDCAKDLAEYIDLIG